jgi:hypothetical protein
MGSTSAEFRHSIRGLLNALKLCVSALELPLDRSEKLGFLSDIEDSADKLIVLIQELGMARDAEAASAESNVR